MELLKFTDEMSSIVSEEAVLEKLETGFSFVEGPVWDSVQQCLFFSDIPMSTIYRWSPSDGLAVYRKPSFQSNGLTLDAQRRLLVCEHESRKLTRAEIDGTVTNQATHYEGKRLNSPNDVVVKMDGSIYFTDPPYGLSNGKDQELPFQGVYRLDPQTGDLRLLVDDFDRPNGLVFSPDERILYIDDSAMLHVRAFDVTPEGTLANGRILAELDPAIGKGAPDGMKVDRQGRIYVTGPGGVWIFSSSGDKIGVIVTPEVTANLAWGGDYRDLYLTSSTSLYRIRLNVQGIPAGQR